MISSKSNGCRPRVLLFTDSFSRGGTERQFVRLLRGLDRSRYDPIIGCLHRRGQLLSEAESLGLPIVEFPINSLYNFRAARLFVQLVQYLRRQEIQIVHVFDFYTLLFAIPAARVAGVPVVLASRRELLNLRSRWQQRAIRVACSLATGVVTNSRAASTDLFGRASGNYIKIELLPNCIDLKEFESRQSPTAVRLQLGLSSTSMVVAALGNLRPEKDLPTFLRAARKIVDVIPSAEFLVIGDGPEKNQLQQLADELDLKKSVHLLGDRSDVADLLGAADILVMCSQTESFPNAILEAMAMRKAVVATNVGGIPELVQEGMTGFLVPPSDPEAIANHVLSLCQDAAQREQMGQTARKRVEDNFTVENVVARLESIYSRFLREHSGAT
jgi:L-malate glycosyltransferase